METEKVYRGSRGREALDKSVARDNIVRLRYVTVQEPGGEERPLVHIPAHCPTGYDWPAIDAAGRDLGLSILADFLEETDKAQEDGPFCFSRLLYQEFTIAVVANLYPDGFELSGRLIEQVLAVYGLVDFKGGRGVIAGSQLCRLIQDGQSQTAWAGMYIFQLPASPADLDPGAIPPGEPEADPEEAVEVYQEARDLEFYSLSIVADPPNPACKIDLERAEELSRDSDEHNPKPPEGIKKTE